MEKIWRPEAVWDAFIGVHAPHPDYAALVDAQLGSNSPGCCLPGPYLPNGMVRLGPDTFYPHPTHGYKHGAPILRFSHTHVAGTGGCSRYGNIGVTPFTGRPRLNGMPPFVAPPLGRSVDAIPVDERAELGLYRCSFRPWNVGVELTSTRQTGVHRYSYPAGQEAWLLIDAASVIQTGLGEGAHLRAVEEWDPEGGSIGGHLEIVNARAWSGRSDFQGGWGHDHPYSIFWWAEASAPALEQILASDGGVVPEAREGSFAVGKGGRLALRFGPLTAPLELRVGISFVSIAQARDAVRRESRDRSLESLVDAHRAEWAALFDRFGVEGGDAEHRRRFFSFLYRLYCMPTDLGVDHENPLWRSGKRHFTDFYCLWDSIRNANSFFTLFDPALARDLANSLLDIADHTGWVPDAHIAHRHAYQQSACAADILFSEARIKGLEGVDYENALRHLRAGVENPSPDLRVKGRYTDEHGRLGYLSTDVTKACVSRHIEYALHDWCIARLAARLGQTEVARDYAARSTRGWNLWREDLQIFAPRRPDGTWAEPFDPWFMHWESWNDALSYEGPVAIWSMNMLHDLPGLISRLGGEAGFIARLDRLFSEVGNPVAKETRMHLPHLYTIVGRPDLCADALRHCLEEHFGSGPDGLKDNEDAGCQSAFYLWHSLGLYPLIGHDLYFLSPPRHDRIVATLPGRAAPLEITRECRGGSDRYIVAATLDGHPLDRAWIRHAEIANGAKLHFVLAATPEDWATTPATRPPLAEAVDPTKF